MNLETLWSQYAANNVPPGASEAQYRATQRAFYAGVAGILGAIDSLVNADADSELMIVTVAGWQREIAELAGIGAPPPALILPS